MSILWGTVAPLTIWTIGHSTREPGEFLALLEAHGVQTLVDVRTVPRSRRVAWSSIDELPQLLRSVGIAYAHMGRALGGLRKPEKDSINDAWRNDSFRGYADHMQTPEFARGVDELISLAERSRACVMCAEAVPWRCHRSLLADALTARGVEVLHIMDNGVRPHEVTSFARVEGARVTYPAASGRQTTLL
jgi:uncharacterized protein (DUF488 family)